MLYTGYVFINVIMGNVIKGYAVPGKWQAWQPNKSTGEIIRNKSGEILGNGLFRVDGELVVVVCSQKHFNAQFTEVMGVKAARGTNLITLDNGSLAIEVSGDVVVANAKIGVGATEEED